MLGEQIFRLNQAKYFISNTNEVVTVSLKYRFRVRVLPKRESLYFTLTIQNVRTVLSFLFTAPRYNWIVHSTPHIYDEPCYEHVGNDYASYFNLSVKTAHGIFTLMLLFDVYTWIRLNGIMFTCDVVIRGLHLDLDTLFPIAVQSWFPIIIFSLARWPLLNITIPPWQTLRGSLCRVSISLDF